MKKIKIMLLSMLVLAAVGGALAFKANSKYNVLYCTAPNLVPPAQGAITDATNCNVTFRTSITIDPVSPLKYFTLANAQDKCVFPAGAKCTAFYSQPE
jgi:hypothetical protein